MGFGNRRAGHTILAESVFEDRLLLQHLGFGNRQVLLPAGYLGFGAHDLNGREGADLHLLFVVVIEPFACGHRFLLHAHVFVESHQVPIEVHHRRDRFDDLLFEDQVGKLALVLGNVDLARVHGNTKSLQQVLRQIEARAS